MRPHLGVVRRHEGLGQRLAEARLEPLTWYGFGLGSGLGLVAEARLEPLTEVARRHGVVGRLGFGLGLGLGLPKWRGATV